MIAEIDTPKDSFSGMIFYNEKKILKGVAELLDNQTFSLNNDPDEFNQILCETAALNNRVYKNKSLSFSINLPPGETVTNEVFKNIAKDYLEGMGYDNNPYLVWRHYDKDHEHIHILTTSVKFSGEKVSEFSNHKRSQKLVLELEKKYGLSPTVFKNKEQLKLNELNAEKYKYQNAIKKALAEDPELQKLISSKLGEEGIKKINSGYLDNKEIGQLFKNNDFSAVAIALEKKGFVYKSDKSKLIEKLVYFRSIAKDKDDYYNKLTNNGIYVKEKKKDGKNFLQYGMKVGEKNFYLNDKYLNTALRYNNVQLIGKDVKIYKTRDEQKDYLKRLVKRAVTKSTNFDEFKARLDLNNIVVKEERHKSGEIFGISFLSAGLENPITFKGSELDRTLSWTNINANLNINLHNSNVNSNKPKVENTPTANFTQQNDTSNKQIPNTKKLGRDMGDESKDEFEREQERKRKNNLDL